MKYGVYKVEWVEKDRFVGQRRDGYSLHATYDEGVDYINHIMEKQREFFRERFGDDRVPEEYDAPSTFKPEFVEVDEDIAELVDRKRNVRYGTNGQERVRY